MKTRRQCKACPWRVDCVPQKDIPGGYCEKKHAQLESTISRHPLASLRGDAPMMACHEFPVGKEQVCVGWLANQLGPGNNLGLRMRAARGDFPPFKLVGEQHETFEDTLPKLETGDES